ncbi:MAG: UDP-N-acetylmuramoyl-L-alanyl-D-glutamate--2,6-diaminopimelate ligase [Tannerella sp.]|jgi:UDP-N-acetylmuramoyl-L-alanyl-D-glutamate--2,6-diaminopimelate ligase|nr:UDP-N-acetylmuramoyl-L-alanyl-D-glutamate--2,6-diaminopimelate ligase [Tannerella sp.]
MNLTEITKSLNAIIVFGVNNKEITGVEFDSRKVKAGYLFVAIKGTELDGHSFINDAISNGATAVICQDMPETKDDKITYILVEDSAEALGTVASEWYGNPSQKLILTGVTGTNGKTTVATLLFEIFNSIGHNSGLISTVQNRIIDKILPATHTTPNAIEINALLAEMLKAGCYYVFMEVSSHAIDQKRISGLRFMGGVFTNLTRDHLDYHKTFEAYRDTKKKFFDGLDYYAVAVTNIDDRNGDFMLQNTEALKYTYSIRAMADYKGKIIDYDFKGTTVKLNGIEVTTPFVGKFNASNITAVFGAAIALGLEADETATAISTLKPVVGRFQTFNALAGYTVIVDYAHTPDAVTNVLNTIHNVANKYSIARKIITVVGCGGDRDKGKRPIMAKEAARLSNILILTSDNPRTENPQAIIDDMLAGLTDNSAARTRIILDRREAIKTACSIAEAGDVVLVAGKGHEDYQEINGERHHFNDGEEVKSIVSRIRC